MKLFWSWQSDNHQPSGRYFVRDVLGALAEELNSEAEDAERPDQSEDEAQGDSGRVSVDHDTLGVGGSPPIADTILRKIREAAVFLADVTPVGKTKGGKFLPNPNVMIELGYALKVLEHRRIVLVMNQAEGGALKHLPFDLRHWRAPVTYSLSRDATDEQREEVGTQLKASLRPLIDASLKEAVRARHEERRRTVREPLLSLAFAPDDVGPWSISQRVIDLGVKTLATIQAETPHLPVPNPRVSGLPTLSRPVPSLTGFGYQKPVSQWSREEIERYNRSVDQYYSKYESYLEAVAEFERLGLRTFEVKLQVENNGNAPATDIDVDIRFPASIILYDQYKGPVAPKAPEAPPRVAVAPGHGIVTAIHHDLRSLLPTSLAPRSEYYYPEDRQVLLKILDLKHHHIWRADPIRLSFATAPDIGPFEIDYYITANEPTDPIEGRLRLEFTRSDAPVPTPATNGNS